MHDNAPVHTAGIVRALLAELWIEVWYGRFILLTSVNPIENLWAIMKAKIYELEPDLENARDTEATLHTADRRR